MHSPPLQDFEWPWLFKTLELDIGGAFMDLHGRARACVPRFPSFNELHSMGLDIVTLNAQREIDADEVVVFIESTQLLITTIVIIAVNERCYFHGLDSRIHV